MKIFKIKYYIFGLFQRFFMFTINILVYPEAM